MPYINGNSILQNRRITFNIYQANGQKKVGLQKSFIEVMELSPTQDSITLADGSHWPLYREKTAPTDVFGRGKYIVSFQVFQDGEYFAVARLHKQRMKNRP